MSRRERAPGAQVPLRSWVTLALCALACSGPGDARVYVTVGMEDEAMRLDPRTGDVVSRIAVDPRPGESDEPHAGSVARATGFWYVSVAHGEPTLWKFDLAADRLVGRVPLGTAGAGRVGITPDGSRAFVPDYFRGSAGRRSDVAVVELYDLAVVARLELCTAPHDAQVHPSGSRVAVACSLSDEIVILDTDTLAELARFYVDAAPGAPGEPRFKPMNLVWAPDGETLYVTLHHAGVVRRFRAEDGLVIGSAATGAGPGQIAITADGRTLVVPNREDRSVSVVEAPALAERIRVRVDGAHPHGVALADDGRTAFVSYEGDTRTPGGVVAIDLEAGSVRWRTETGGITLGVAYARP